MPDLPRTLLRRAAAGIGSLARKGLLLAALVALVLVGIRAWHSTQGPPLRPWHTIVPIELSADAIAKGNWQAYVRAESRMFEQLQRRLRGSLEAGDRNPLNRYYEASLVSPTAFGRDWNRSFVLEPAGTPTGVVVLLHGLSDSPYSMHNLAELYRQHGFIAIAPRMPGHGTVPASLTREGSAEWQATVEMAMAEAVRRAGGKLPVHLVGYSNGAALALLHEMHRIERGAPVDVQRIVLLSPMIEVKPGARYVGLAALPALFSRYAKSAWLELLPEYNPFKYNSFPVRGARQSYLVTAELREAMDAVLAQHAMGRLPPILAFQSVVDDTVNARAVMTGLFDRFGANGSELVLFDVNRSREMDPMLDAKATAWSRNALQGAPLPYTLTVVGNASLDDASALAWSRAAGESTIQEAAIGLDYPVDVYSLSHVALPFPANDPLYGNLPSGRRGVQLGGIAIRGERNTLLVSQENLGRISYNPFHAYMAARIAASMPAPAR